MILAAQLLQFNGYEDDGIEGEDCDSDVGDDSESEADTEDEEQLSTSFELLELLGVEVIRCAAHVLALIVDDTLDKLNIQSKLAKVRKLVKFLRNPTSIENIRAQVPKLNLPRLDNKTRWNTKYDMILSLIPLKSYCDQFVPVKEKITESEWTFCRTFLDLFKPVKIATKKLQSEQLSLGDFYKVWLDLTLDLKKQTASNKNPTLAAALYQNLMSREKLLFEKNQCLPAALYLDPRFRNILTKLRPNQFNIREIQEHPLSLYKQIKKVEVSDSVFVPFNYGPQNLTNNKLQNKILIQFVQSPEDETTSVDEPPQEQTEAPHEHLHQETENENVPLRLRLRSNSTIDELPVPSTSRGISSESNSNQTTSRDPSNLDAFINGLHEDNSEECPVLGEDDVVAAFGIICSYQDRKPLDTNVLEYWHAKRFSNPVLCKLATVVHAVPATQVSVERCFSVLKFILNDYRTSIRSDTLENLMLLRLNAGLKQQLS